MKDFPASPILTESDLTHAIELLSQSAIFLKDGSIHFKQRLAGGGCTQSRLGLTYMMQENYPLAIRYLSECVAIRKPLRGNQDPDIATTINYIGVCHIRLQNGPAALAMFEEAYATRKAVFGEEHPDTVAVLENIKIARPVPIPTFIEEVAEAPFPPFWSVPKRNQKFVGRESSLIEIKKRFTASGEAPTTDVSIAGLGGVGKTSLVLEYLHRNRGQYTTVWWISAEQPLSGFRDLGEALGIVKPTDDEDTVIKTVREWMEENPNWLVVFDNVEDKSTLTPFLPTTGKGGHILTTSRNPHSKESIVVGTFSKEESIQLLTTLTEQNDSGNAEALAEILGHLPLALTQAGSYIHSTKTSFAEYLALFDTVRKELWKDEIAPENYPQTVGTTWNISVRRIHQEMPEALNLLDRSAFVAPDNIPVSLFKKENLDDTSLYKYLHLLQRYSFFTPGQKDDTYSVHRLVQATTRDNIDLVNGKQFIILEELVDRLFSEWKYEEAQQNTWPKTKLLIPHVLAFRNFGKHEERFFKPLSFFINDIGAYNKAIEVNLTLAIEYFTESLQMRTVAFGKEHKLVAVTLNNLSVVYRAKGDIEQATLYSTESIRVRKIAYGDDSLEVVVSLSNLGEIYRSEGKLEDAQATLSEALLILKKVGREEGHHLAVVENNLGKVLHLQEKLPEAEKHFNESLRISRKIYNEDHATIAACLNNLATVYMDMKDYDRAAQFTNDSLKINKALYGDDHLSVALNLRNLGEICLVQGDPHKAAEHLLLALEIVEKSYGKDSPDLLDILTPLGSSYLMHSDLSKGLKYFERAYKIVKETGGKKHPDYQKLQLMINQVGDIDRLMKTLELEKKANGGHPLPNGNHQSLLGLTYMLDLDYTVAIQHLGKSVAIRKSLGGDQNPDIATTLNYLGICHSHLQNMPDALVAFEEAYTIRKALLGEEHADTVEIWDNIERVQIYR